VEGLHEEGAPHLAVADDVDAGALLVTDGQLGGVERLVDVGLPVVAGLDARCLGRLFPIGELGRGRRASDD
jgi:hypothetical protein